jgi:hypothetical protein
MNSPVWKQRLFRFLNDSAASTPSLLFLERLLFKVNYLKIWLINYFACLSTTTWCLGDGQSQTDRHEPAVPALVAQRKYSGRAVHQSSTPARHL